MGLETDEHGNDYFTKGGAKIYVNDRRVKNEDKLNKLYLQYLEEKLFAGNTFNTINFINNRVVNAPQVRALFRKYNFNATLANKNFAIIDQKEALRGDVRSVELQINSEMKIPTDQPDSDMDDVLMNLLSSSIRYIKSRYRVDIEQYNFYLAFKNIPKGQDYTSNWNYYRKGTSFEDYLRIAIEDIKKFIHSYQVVLLSDLAIKLFITKIGPSGGAASSSTDNHTDADISQNIYSTKS